MAGFAGTWQQKPAPNSPHFNIFAIVGGNGMLSLCEMLCLPLLP